MLDRKSTIVVATLALLLCIQCPNSGVAREYPRTVSSPTFCAYSEVAGAGLTLWSVHTELTVFRFSHDTSGLGILHSLRLSVGYDVAGYVLPVAAKFILLESSHHIETGLGVTFPLKVRSNQDVFPQQSAAGVGILGYRFEPQNGGLLLRATINPWIDLSTLNGGLIFGFSLGVAI